jgi:hypothetical protein
MCVITVAVAVLTSSLPPRVTRDLFLQTPNRLSLTSCQRAIIQQYLFLVSGLHGVPIFLSVVRGKDVFWTMAFTGVGSLHHSEPGTPAMSICLLIWFLIG